MNMNTLHTEEDKRPTLSGEVRFYTQQEVSELTGWSDKVVRRLFCDPDFPASDWGKAKIVEAHALIDFFSVRRNRPESSELVEGELKDALKQRLL